MKSAQLTVEMRELELQTFSIAFETALEEIAEGRSFTNFCQEYHQPLSPSRFRAWIFRDNKRYDAYANAKLLSAEAMEDDMIRIADDCNQDPSRSSHMLETRKFIMKTNNRAKYGDIKQIIAPPDNTDLKTLTTDDLKRLLLEQSESYS